MIVFVDVGMVLLGMYVICVRWKKFELFYNYWKEILKVVNVKENKYMVFVIFVV